MLNIISCQACLQKPSMIFRPIRNGPRTIKRDKKLASDSSKILSQGLATLVIFSVVLLIVLIGLLLTRPRSGFEKETKQHISTHFQVESHSLVQIINRG